MMLKRLSFLKKVFIYLSIIFTVFTVLVLLFQYDREKEFRKKQLENTLGNVTELTYKYIVHNNIVDSNNYRLLDSIKKIIPGDNTRITVISPSGIVLYDSEVEDFENMENHLHRPEVQSSVLADFGSNIRKSSTTNNMYYYYAEFYKDYYLRAAALYNPEVKDFLQVEKLFIIYIISLFLILWIVLMLVTRRLGETLTKLKDFAIKLRNGELPQSIEFPNDELGVVSSQIVEIYKELDAAKNDISVEKNKLFNHLHALNEGVAFFSPKKEKILTNNHFIQFLNLISESSTISAEKIFDVKEFKEVTKFIDEQLKKEEISTDENNQFEQNISLKGKYFEILCVFFRDMSFEIVIKDTTKLEKRKRIKQQMTSNIAHELKTPVATVMGYLETIQTKKLEPKKQEDFINKAFLQAKHLSELIEDISMLNKIEETKEYFTFEKVNINEVVDEVSENLQLKLNENNIKVNIDFEKDISINGNKSLLSSIFYNLFDNAIKYGGENVGINITNYLEDKTHYYFSFSNTGNEIDEEHLSRVFERFYRVDTGRSRKSGGTGLGLAIVNNAVQIHNGEISARRYKEGGVEFLISLSK